MSLVRFPLRTRLIRSLSPMRLTVRTVTSTSAGAKAKSRYDKTIIKPILLVMVFGSILNSVIVEKRKAQDMERKYHLKANKLKELIQRVNDNNGKVDFDADDELRLVNLCLGITDKNIVSTEEDKGDIVIPKEESLEEIWQSIIDEAKKDIVEPTKNDDGTNKKGIVTDVNVLRDLQNSKKGDEQVYLNGDIHMIMNQPGDLNEIAKENAKIPKFL